MEENEGGADGLGVVCVCVYVCVCVCVCVQFKCRVVSFKEKAVFVQRSEVREWHLGMA